MAGKEVLTPYEKLKKPPKKKPDKKKIGKIERDKVDIATLEVPPEFDQMIKKKKGISLRLKKGGLDRALEAKLKRRFVKHTKDLEYMISKAELQVKELSKDYPKKSMRLRMLVDVMKASADEYWLQWTMPKKGLRRLKK